MDHPQQIMNRLKEIAVAVRNAQQKQIADTGLQLAQVNMLRILHLYGPMTQKEIDDRLLIRSATVTVTIKTLAKQGYLEKVQSQQDLRYNTIHLTPKAVTIAENATLVFDNLRDEIFAGLDHSQLALIDAWLQQFLQNIQNLL